MKPTRPRRSLSLTIVLIIARALISILAMPFLLVLGVPALVFSKAKGAISLRAFRRREAGHVYLICTSRRNWHDFLKNNVIPVLPDNFRVVWHKSVRDGEHPAVLGHVDRSGILGVPKPYLVAVTRRALVHKSLNRVLQEFKAHPKKSEETRRACGQIIAQTEQELRATRSTASA